MARRRGTLCVLLLGVGPCVMGLPGTLQHEHGPVSLRAPLPASQDQQAGTQRTLVSFAYYEGREGARENLQYFLRAGIDASQPGDGPISYGFVINGFDCSEPIPTDRDDIVVLKRANEGFDYGAHTALLRYIAQAGVKAYRGEMAVELWDFGSESQQLTAAQLPFDKYVFLNAGVRGPFLPAYWPKSRSWTRVYLDKLSPSVKLVGNSIVCLPESDLCVKGGPGITPNPDCYGPKVEGYAWATDQVGLQVLLDRETVFQSHPDKVSAILNGEYGMNIAIFKAGYTIDSLLLAYQGVDWTNRSNWGCNDNEHPSRSGTYFGVTQHPLETVFVKVEWVHDDGTIDKIMPNFVDAYTDFQKLGWARSSAAAGATASDRELSRAVLPSL